VLINTTDEAAKTGHKLLSEPPATTTTRKAARTAATTANETAGAYLTKSSLSSADNSVHDNNNNNGSNINNNNSAVSIQLPATNESIAATQLQMSLATYAPLHNKKSKCEIKAAKTDSRKRTSDTK